MYSQDIYSHHTGFIFLKKKDILHFYKMSFLDVDIEIDEFFLKNIKRVQLLYFCTEM